MYQNQGHRQTLTIKKPHSANGKQFDYHKKRLPGSQRDQSHDKELKRLKESGEMVKIELMSGSTVIGTISDSDKHTIKIDCLDGIKRTHFKHAIVSFGVVSQE